MDDSTKTIMNHEWLKTSPQEYVCSPESGYEDYEDESHDCFSFEVVCSPESDCEGEDIWSDPEDEDFLGMSAGLARTKSPIPRYCRYSEPESDSEDEDFRGSWNRGHTSCYRSLHSYADGIMDIDTLMKMKIDANDPEDEDSHHPKICGKHGNMEINTIDEVMMTNNMILNKHDDKAKAHQETNETPQP